MSDAGGVPNRFLEISTACHEFLNVLCHGPSPDHHLSRNDDSNCLSKSLLSFSQSASADWLSSLEFESAFTTNQDFVSSTFVLVEHVMNLPTPIQLRGMLRTLGFGNMKKINRFLVVGSVAKGKENPNDLDVAVEMTPVRGYESGLKFTEKWHFKQAFPFRNCADPGIWMPRWNVNGHELPVDFQFFFEGEGELKTLEHVIELHDESFVACQTKLTLETYQWN